MLENFWRISETPSRYQIGNERYIGGATRKRVSVLAPANSPRTTLNCLKMGSIRLEMEDVDSAEAVMKLVMHERMTTLVVWRT